MKALAFLAALVAGTAAALGMARADDSLPGVFDLPSAKPARAIAIIYSGDGGWQDLDRTIGEWMAGADIHVIGISTVKAFWDTRPPEQVARDIADLLAKADPSASLPVMLIGYSFGADILPFAWPHLDPATQTRTHLIALLAPERTTAFHVSVEGWLGIETGSYSVTDAMASLPAERLLCVYGEDEVDDSGCTGLSLPGMTLLHTPGGHHFDEGYIALGQLIIDAFDAHSGPEQSVPADPE